MNVCIWIGVVVYLLIGIYFMALRLAAEAIGDMMSMRRRTGCETLKGLGAAFLWFLFWPVLWFAEAIVTKRRRG